MTDVPTSKRKIVFGASAGIATAVAAILGSVYANEGGYVNNSKDPGGETNYGITKQTAIENRWKGSMKTFPKFCYSEKDICADKIYYENYIDKPGFIPFISLSEPIGAELVDSGVNTGTKTPKYWLQQSLNEACDLSPKLSVDGVLKQKDYDYFKSCRVKIGPVKFCVTMLNKLDDKQKQYYLDLVARRPSSKVFLKGWLAKRINNVPRSLCNSEK